MTGKYSLKKTSIALSLIQALAITPTFAATVVVDVSGESDTACSLRNAVESINTGQNVGGCNANGVFGAGDVVTFAVSQVSGLESELLISNDVLINPGGRPVVISAKPNTNNRVLAIRNSSVEIDNVTITGGRVSDRSDGGGIDVRDSQLSLLDVELIDNTADGDGGGLYLRGSQVFINNSRIANNSADDGGGIHSRDSSLRITNSVVSANRTESSRTGGDDGGGIYARSGFVSIANSTISDNNAVDEGGGIFVRESTFTLSNSTVSGNNVGDDGGGINIDFLADVSILHSTFSNNTSGRIGGGISVSSGSLNLSNSLVVGNRTEAGVLPSSEINLSAAGTLNFLGRNLIGDDSTTLAQALNFSPPSSVILATSDSGQAARLASILNPLSFNAGVTQTHALVEGSPAVDTASSSICRSSPINNRDQRRLQRTKLCDIGAFELGATEPIFQAAAIIPPILFLLLKEEN